MKNDVILDGKKISVPPTLLFTLMGNHEDVTKAVSSDFKESGDLIYLLGETYQELGASELVSMLQDETGGGIGGNVPEIDAPRNLAMYRSLTSAMRGKLVASAHDCSDGGLATAFAEACFGADVGAFIDISGISSCDELNKWGTLFGESLGRILVSVKPVNSEKFEDFMAGHKFTQLGLVGITDEIHISNGSDVLLQASMSELKNSWQGTLNGGS
jgi:phosphoribosylformylglycinamidine synthase